MNLLEVKVQEVPVVLPSKTQLLFEVAVAETYEVLVFAIIRVVVLILRLP